MKSDEYFMQRCIALAKRAEATGEVPVGALVVYENQIISEGFNQPISTLDPSSHAELIALRKACLHFKNYRLPKEVKVYVTLEPCAMCAGAMVHARVSEVIYGAKDEKTGAAGSVFNVLSGNSRNHIVQAKAGVLQTDCSALLTNFFRNKRLKTKPSL